MKNKSKKRNLEGLINIELILDFIQKNTQFIRLNDIIEKSYEIYELKKRFLLTKIFIKQYF